MVTLKTSTWQINDIDTVLFDKDGTLIDLHYFWGKMTELRCDEIIKIYNHPLATKKTLCEFLGYDINKKLMLPNGITALYSRTKIIEIFNKKLIDIGINTNESEIEKIFDNTNNLFYSNIHKYTKPIENAIKFVQKLYDKRVNLGIVTSDSIISTNLTLKQFGWDKYFKVIVGRETSTLTKESGALTQIALKKLNANPNNTLMIGDTPTDYISAKNAGINNTILVTTGQLAKNELLKTSKYVIENLTEIELD